MRAVVQRVSSSKVTVGDRVNRPNKQGTTCFTWSDS